MTASAAIKPQDDPFDHHRRNLAGEKVAIHDGHPEVGFYRRRFKGPRNSYGPWLPASIFYDEGKLVCEINGEPVDANEQWIWLVKHPISEDDYRYHVEHGHWPHDFPIAEGAAAQEETRHAVGGNNPPDELPLEEPGATAAANEESSPAETSDNSDPELDALLKQVEETKVAARKAYADLTTTAEKAVADRAQNIRDRLKDLSKQIDNLRTLRKEPYLKATRAVDDYFRDAISHPLDIEKSLGARVKAWLDAERARLLAAQRAEQERIESERRQAAEAEAERQRLEAAGREPAAVDLSPPPPPPSAPPPPMAEPKILLGGGYSGRRSSARKVVTATITDQDAVYQHFKAHADVIALLQKLANAAIQKTPVPGCERHEGEQV